MYDVHKGEMIDAESLKSDKGIAPSQVADMLALMGDNADNIPGVPGIGPRTAAKLIAQYGSLDRLLQHTGELSGKLKENIEKSREALKRSRQLVELRYDVPIDFSLEDAAVEAPPASALRPLFKQLGFNRHLTDLEKIAGVETDSREVISKSEPRESYSAGSGLFAALFDDVKPATSRSPQDSSVACQTGKAHRDRHGDRSARSDAGQTLRCLPVMGIGIGSLSAHTFGRAAKSS
jgi:DNA polymerase-1